MAGVVKCRPLKVIKGIDISTAWKEEGRVGGGEEGKQTGQEVNFDKAMKVQ